jgi:hypothetical protein
MPEEQVTQVKTEIIQSNALESIERASIDMQISTAKKYPMHAPTMLSKVKEDMLSLATLDEDTAAACFYVLPRGGKSIPGPSVRLAEIALNCYGNIRVGARILEVISHGDNPHVIVQSVCHDLENNALITIEKRRRITKKRNNPNVDEDDINLAVNACTSIAYRDTIFKIIPRAIIDSVWRAARSLAVGNIKSLTEKRVQVIDRLKQMGAPEDRILAVVNCRKIEDIGIDQLSQLIGLGTALKDGETTLEDAFPPIQPEEKVGVGPLKERMNRNLKKDNTVVDPEIEKKKAEQLEKLKQAEQQKKKVATVTVDQVQAIYAAYEDKNPDLRLADHDEKIDVFAVFCTGTLGGATELYWCFDEDMKKTFKLDCFNEKNLVQLKKAVDELEILNKPEKPKVPEDEPDTKTEKTMYVCVNGHEFEEPKQGGTGIAICPKCLTKKIKVK